MTSQLVTTFLDRGDLGSNRWLEIWVFRDGTLNIVIASESSKETEEHVFPCAPYQLQHMLAGQKFLTESPAGYVRMDRKGDDVVATFMRASDSQGWSQVVPVCDIDCSLHEAAKLAAATSIRGM